MNKYERWTGPSLIALGLHTHWCEEDNKIPLIKNIKKNIIIINTTIIIRRHHSHRRINNIIYIHEYSITAVRPPAIVIAHVINITTKKKH